MGQKTKSVSPLTRSAAFAPSTVNAEKRTVDVVWTTGAKVLRNSWYDGPSWEELSLEPKHVRMGRLNNGAPFLRDHRGDTENVIGVVENARLEKGQGVATVRFVSEGIDPEADKIFAKVRDGVIQNISVGYRTYRSEKIEDVNEKIPTFRATDWEPYEISAVGMGADDAAGFRSADNSTQNACDFVSRGNEMEPEELKRQQEAAKAEAKRMADEASTRAVLVERERVSGITSAVRALKLDASFGEKMITDGVSLSDARTAVIAEAARVSETHQTNGQERATASDIQVTTDVKDKQNRGLTAWVYEKAGNGLIELAQKRGVKGFSKDEISLDGGEFRGMGLTDLARFCLKRQGVKGVDQIYDKKRLFDLAIQTRGAYSGTSDFAILFENVMYKTLRAAYGTQEDTWRRWCGTDTVQDFKASNRFMNGSFGTLPVVQENAEYTNLAIPDGSKISITTETRGAIIGLSRQALINDDMGALVDVAVRFGRTAGRTIEAEAYAALLLNSGLGPTMSDSAAYFHANRANVSTAAALSIAALDADRLKMRQQMDISSNDYLDLNPAILLVPVGLESAARVLNESANDFTSSSSSNKPNVVRGMFNDIVSTNRLSGTRRYLFTANKEAFKVVFLEGSGEGPTMDTNDGFRTDGQEWKVRCDFKVNAYDPKTAITNAGA